MFQFLSVAMWYVLLNIMLRKTDLDSLQPYG